MTQKEFIKQLDKKGYSYKIERGKIIITEDGDVYLGSLTSISPGVEFKNGGVVNLSALTSLPPGVEFRNVGHVDLQSLTSISSGVEFRNGGHVDLSALTSLPPGVEFKNGRDVYLGYLMDRWIDEWQDNIEGINNKGLLNLMISKGLFI